MAQTNPAITFDFEALSDAVGELVDMHRRLAHRHGERFRALDREIEAFCEQPVDVDFSAVEPGLFFAAMPALANLLRKGRALGV